MGEPAERILSSHRLQGLPNGLLQRFMRPGADPSQKGFELGEGFFARRVIGRVGWQEEELTTPCLDELTHARAFMGAQIGYSPTNW